MKTNFNVTGDRRKELVGVLEEILGAGRKYCGAPSFAYEVGELTVNKDGVVEGQLSDETLRLLSEQGFKAELQGDKTSKSTNILEPTFFESDAKTIQRYAKQILSDGEPHTAKDLKAEVARLSGQSFSVGAYAGAFRELTENDCRYATEERGSYKYTPFDGDEDILPFLSILVSTKSKLVRLRDKAEPNDAAAFNRVSQAIQKLDVLITELRAN